MSQKTRKEIIDAHCKKEDAKLLVVRTVESIYKSNQTMLTALDSSSGRGNLMQQHPTNHIVPPNIYNVILITTNSFIHPKVKKKDAINLKKKK